MSLVHFEEIQRLMPKNVLLGKIFRNQSFIMKISIHIFSQHFLSLTQNVDSKTMIKSALPPTYKNQQLQQMISENKNNSVLYFSNEQLIDNDMEIISYYLLRNNTVCIRESYLYIIAFFPKNI